MKIELTVMVKMDINLDETSTKFYGKPYDKWTAEELLNFKNEIASEFNMYDLASLNEKGAGIVSNRKVISFE